MTEIICIGILGVLSAGCTFDPPSINDAGDSGPTGCWNHTPSHFDPCNLENPSGSLTLDGSDYTYDTTTGELRDELNQLIPHQQQELDGYRVLSVSSFAVEQDTILRVIGDRPLIVASWDTIDINGEINVTSETEEAGAAANPAECGTSAPVEGQNDNGGAAGGGGGAFQGAGGDGGNGDGNGGQSNGGMGGTSVMIPTRVRGGCPGANGGQGFGGSPGMGGAGGGAIQLTAQVRVRVRGGEILAGGAGGQGGLGGDSGGGGGGSGGFIGLDAAKVEVENARLMCNGGGGGEGAGDPPGNDGEPGGGDASAAPGGSDGADSGSDGGVGGYRDQPNGLPPVNLRNGGGGGGGGGVGYILVFTDDLDLKGGNQISPAQQDGRPQ